MDVLPKVLTHAFGPKMANFVPFFSRGYRHGKCLLRYSRTKTTFLGYKNKKFKKSKNSHFSKGVNPWFWSKMVIFRPFFLRQYRPGKCLLRYCRPKKTPFQTLKTRSSKSRKIDIFPKGVNHRFGPKMAFFFSQYRPAKCLLRYSRTKKRLSRL